VATTRRNEWQIRAIRRPLGRVLQTRADLRRRVGRPGQASADSDIVDARFVDLVPGVRVVQAVDFVSDDPANVGTMTMTWELAALDAGTRVDIRAGDVPGRSRGRTRFLAREPRRVPRAVTGPATAQEQVYCAGRPDSCRRQSRDAWRRRRSLADADELGVAVCHELGCDASAYSAVPKVLADRLTREGQQAPRRCRSHSRSGHQSKPADLRSEGREPALLLSIARLLLAAEDSEVERDRVIASSPIQSPT
jgi:hypothetical protein